MSKGSTRVGGGGAERSRGIAVGGTPNTLRMRRRLRDFATAGMLADLGQGRYGQVEAPGVEATVPSPLAQTRNPDTVLI